jgi:thiamine pyrophosphate-dependent acetolactate synthase large subunit-like protein
VPELVRRALTLVRNGRPGPVLLDLPLEAVVGECDPAEVARFGAVPRWRSCADPSEVERVAAALLDAERPVVQAGQGVLYSDASEELVELAELLGLPVMTTLAGKSAFPEDHALSLGSAGLAWPRAVSELVERADFLLAVGASLTASQFAFPVPPGKRVAQVVVDERDVNKDYAVEFALLGDAKLVIRQIVDEVKRRRDADAVPPNGRAIPSAIRAAKQEDEREWGPRLASDEVPISPYRVIAEVAKATSGLATVVTHDSGRPRDQVSAFWESRSPRSYLGWGKSTQLGHGLGLIMGAKLAAPEKLAINFMGDAAIGMVGMELESAARLEIPILTVVLNNKGMSHYENRYPIANRRYGFKALGGDYCAVAKALGVVGEHVDEPGALRAALDRAIEAVQDGRPVLLEVATKEEAAVSQPRESTFIPRWAEVRAEGRLLDARA